MKLSSVYVFIVALFVVYPLSAQNQRESSSLSDTESTQSVEIFSFDSIEQQNRAIHLARQLRCPQCQNQNLMESNSPIAKDLRLKVYLMVSEGKTDPQVIDFMTSRFGDMVLYKPKFEPRTYVLWLGPVFLMLLFGWLGYRKVTASIVD
ncbi:heme lyase NrfEFG subunit NrfF [Moritella dasanensis]|uniref:heme lyase NrfEFG subunit NrfF n=1 Tax=Moritella dasanensis TaxID=428031 RepID=UPI00030440BF|nr:heme lyase NrfEFG subunit NrfF [Moritella dasanensis]